MLFRGAKGGGGGDSDDSSSAAITWRFKGGDWQRSSIIVVVIKGICDIGTIVASIHHHGKGQKEVKEAIKGGETSREEEKKEEGKET